MKFTSGIKYNAQQANCNTLGKKEMSVLPEQEFGCNQIYCEQVVYTREKGDEGIGSKKLTVPEKVSTVGAVGF